MDQFDTNDDEIDLRELFQSLWAGRRIIALGVVILLFFASVFLWTAERKFTVDYVFKPVSSDNNSPKLGGLGGLASLAGVSLPTGGSGDFLTFKALLQSEEVAAHLLKDHDLVAQIYGSEWNGESREFQPPKRSVRAVAIGWIKTLLTGERKADYMPPNAARLSRWLKGAFSVSEERDTGFLKLSSETPRPDLLVSVMTQATQITDQIIKTRFVETGESTVKFYQRKIATARSREHREALAQLIMQEEQKLMLASNGGFFVVEPLTIPSVSLQPTSPKSPLVLALSIVLGLFVGAGIVLIRKGFSDG